MLGAVPIFLNSAQTAQCRFAYRELAELTGLDALRWGEIGGVPLDPFEGACSREEAASSI